MGSGEWGVGSEKMRMAEMTGKRSWKRFSSALPKYVHNKCLHEQRLCARPDDEDL